MQKAFLSPILRNPTAVHHLVNPRNGQVLADRLNGAFDSKSRKQGLLGRDTFAEGEGILIAPSNAIHTFFMRFSIDIAFLRRDGHVLSIRHGLKPWRVAVSPRAYLVVELPAGTLTRTDTRAGDQLILGSGSSF